MAYRERLAWLMLAGMVVAYGPFFAILARETAAGEPTISRFLLLFGIASGARVAIELGGRIALAVRMGADARAPADERDNAIGSRSSGFAYIVLLIGMIVVGLFMPFSAQGIRIVTAALIAIIAAELVRCLAIVLGYRLGWQ